MGKIDWLKKLGWSEAVIDEMRSTGFSYIRQGKYDIALSFFEALCILDSQEPYDYQTLGAIHLQLNDPKNAIKAFDRALKLSTDHAPTLLNLCKALFMLGKKEEGLKLAKILKNEPNPAISNMAKALVLAYSTKEKKLTNSDSG